MAKNKISRRKFLGQASCAAIGSTTFFSTLLNLGMTGVAAAAAPPSDYKALVCIMLEGGNDSYNMLVPRGASEHAQYAEVRSNIALPSGSLLPINPATSDGKLYGLHPSMPEVQGLFENDKLAFIANVGTLLEPTNAAQYYDNLVQLPLGLFSHSDQIRHWQTSLPQDRGVIGWGGRMADLLHGINVNQNVSMNISLNGANVFQSGNDVIEYTISNYENGSYGLLGYDDPWDYALYRRSAIDNMLDANYQDVFKQTYAGMVRNAQDTHEQFSTAIAGVSPFTTVFSDNELSNSLHMIAKTIAAREQLGLSRQTFFINFGGWDHHDEVLNGHAAMLGIVSAALGQFQSALEEIGIEDNVTTYTMSDFARTLSSNGNGTDHGWGGHAMVMGGAVNGGDIYGTYPELNFNGPLEVGGGVLVPTTSCDEYFAELALWLGVSHGDLATVLPNIGNFYSPTAGTQPLGFMQM